MKNFQPGSEPQMVQQNATAVWRSQEVSSFGWTTKLYPPPKTLQPYNACHSKPFELTKHAPQLPKCPQLTAKF